MTAVKVPSQDHHICEATHIEDKREREREKQVAARRYVIAHTHGEI